MIEKLLLAGILTFALSLFTQLHPSPSLGRNLQIKTHNNTVLTYKLLTPTSPK